MGSTDHDLQQTPLHDLHLENGARMVPFAGYEMPIQYTGVIAEHTHTRTAASLFDVSHMGVVHVSADSGLAAAAAALETALPSDIVGLAPGRIRYSFLTNTDGGIVDDLMIGNEHDRFSLIVNAVRKVHDVAHLDRLVGDRVTVRARPDLAVLALQGPLAVDALARQVPAVVELVFMQSCEAVVDEQSWRVSRSGYTGEDGFELVVPVEIVDTVARRLLAEPEVELAGLGARDTLRLEAGLCLYGNDLDETTTPVEANLTWAMQKRRRDEGGFPGAEIIAAQLAAGVARTRVGIRPGGRKPVRDGAALTTDDGASIGVVTSGGYGPTVEAPIAMGYVAATHARPGTSLVADVRGKPVACTVASLPFTEHRYHRG